MQEKARATDSSRKPGCGQGPLDMASRTSSLEAGPGLGSSSSGGINLHLLRLPMPAESGSGLMRSPQPPWSFSSRITSGTSLCSYDATVLAHSTHTSFSVRTFLRRSWSRSTLAASFREASSPSTTDADATRRHGGCLSSVPYRGVRRCADRHRRASYASGRRRGIRGGCCLHCAPCLIFPSST